jgi:hypothetical protein
MNDAIGRNYLNDALASFRDYKKLAEKAFGQLKDEEFFTTLDEEGNSVGVIIKHMTGNMISRWADFLNTDGEKPDRNRDMEFVLAPATAKQDLIEQWERGWAQVFQAIEPLEPADLAHTVFIRGKAHTVVEAINRQLTHYAQHIGQIIFLSKHLRSREWQTLSIPRNRSAEFNAYLSETPQTEETDKGARRSRFEQAQDFVNSKTERQ